MVQGCVFRYAVLLLVKTTFATQSTCKTPEPGHKASCLLQKTKAASSLTAKQELHDGIVGDLRKLRKHAFEEVKKDVSLEKANSETVEVTYPPSGTPLVSCGQATNSNDNAQEQENLHKALEIFCKAGLGSYAEFFVDPAYQTNYERWSDDQGWINDAFVTFMGTKDAKANIAAEEDLLVRSVQHFSEKPVVVANFNSRVPASFNASKFPNMILMHARSTSEVYGSFNYNKITAMMFTKVRHGMVLDGDQFVSHGVDTMFSKIAAETTEAYPYPIMPVHWMSRDPESSDMKGGYSAYAWNFHTDDAPKRTMRWGQAHPTWTHYALPWLAKWTSFILAPSKTNPPHWLSSIGHVEDEDLLNVAMWSDRLKKQWCRYDVTSPTDFRSYLQQLEGGPSGVDSKYYPKGIAIVYFTAHDAKTPSVSYDYLKQLWDDSDGHHHRKAIFYNGKWFSSASKLKESDPNIPCIL